MNMSLNKVYVGGFLGKTAEVRWNSKGANVCTFYLGTIESGNAKPTWHKCVAFGNLARAMDGRRTGDWLMVEGMLKTYDEQEQKVVSVQRVQWMKEKGEL